MRYVNEDRVPESYAVTLMLIRRVMRSRQIHSHSSGLMARVNADRCDRRLIGGSRVLKSRKSLDNLMRQNTTAAGTGAITTIKTNFGANDIVFGQGFPSRGDHRREIRPHHHRSGRSLLC